jgi:hypothetical protein
MFRLFNDSEMFEFANSIYFEADSELNTASFVIGSEFLDCYIKKSIFVSKFFRISSIYSLSTGVFDFSIIGLTIYSPSSKFYFN